MNLIHRLAFCLIVLLSTSLLHGSHNLVNAAVDPEDDGQVETEEPEVPAQQTDSLTPTEDAEDDDDYEDKPLKPSPDADTFFMFTKPSGGVDLPAGSVVEFLVGFTNKGPVDFTVETIDASFRYPIDYSFYIQNFSTFHYNRVVKPKQQVTLAYSFLPSEAFASRPFGLTVNLNYKDSEGTSYMQAVFNETVNITELDEAWDGETIFLYIFLAACGIFVFVAGQQIFLSFGKKKPSSKKQHIEIGTSNPNDVDFDWIPKETLNELNKSSPRTSPKARKSKRGGPNSEE